MDGESPKRSFCWLPVCFDILDSGRRRPLLTPGQNHVEVLLPAFEHGLDASIG
jgi:hypothetical protein